MTNIVDLFAGAGGWDVAARRLGFEPLGYELDDDAVKTRRAANMPTVQEDIAKIKPCGPGLIDGLIASPPCQSFSSAGKRSGLNDERGQLVWTPLEWARSALPLWCAWEQVPEVLPIWRECATALRALGYSVWVGLLDAERYGVPQTRTRAILMAHRERPMVPPEPTHQKYHHDVPRGDPHACGLDNMFDAGVKPWVSMAEALGWGMTERPAMTLAPGTGGGGPDIAGGSGARAIITRERDEGRWVHERPTTTVTTDSRIATPGHHDENTRSFGEGAIKLTVEQAATLQTFPADHPWQGSNTSKHKQIGNAIPPLLAEAVLAAVIGYREGSGER